METFLNMHEYDEVQQIENEYEGIQQYDMQPEQSFVDDVEMAEEQNEVSETSRLKYNADAVIQDEIKELISKKFSNLVMASLDILKSNKETENTNLIILNEKRGNIIHQIRDAQNLRDKFEEGADVVKTNAEMTKEEIANLHKRVTHNGGIAEKIEEFRKTTENSFTQLKFRNQQHFAKLKNLKEKVVTFQNNYKANIFKIKKDLNNHKKMLNDPSNNDPNKNENLLLKRKIIEKQEYLKELIEDYKTIDGKRNKINELKYSQEKLENVLKTKNDELYKLNEIKNQNKMNIQEYIKLMNFSLEEGTIRLNTSLDVVKNINNEIGLIKKNVNDKNDNILKKEESFSKLKEITQRITDCIKSEKLALDAHIEQHRKNYEVREEEIKKMDAVLMDAKNENNELSCSLETLKKTYIFKVEENNQLLVSKLELEKQLNSEEILLYNIKATEEQIDLQKKSSNDLLEKIKKFSTNGLVQDLLKKKAYLISSTDYLTEKQDNIRAQLENLNLVIKNFQNDVEANKQIIEEKQNEYGNLLTHLEEERAQFQEIQQSTVPASILKSPLSQKKITSPKKVQFQNLSSFESSSETANNSQSPQQAAMGKTFDDILAEIQDSFKKPLKAPKKRKLEFEI